MHHKTSQVVDCLQTEEEQRKEEIGVGMEELNDREDIGSSWKILMR